MSKTQPETDYSYILSHDSKTHCPIETALEMLRYGQIREPEAAESIIATFKELLPKPKQIEWVADDDEGEDGVASGVRYFRAYRFATKYHVYVTSSAKPFDGLDETTYNSLQEAKDACQQAFNEFVLSLVEGA